MAEVLEKYYDYLVCEKRVSQNTLLAYKRDIKKYAEFLDENRLKLADVTGVNVLDYLMFQEKAGKSSSTIASGLAAIRSLYQFMQNNQLVKINPTLQIHSLKVEKKTPDILSVKEMDALLRQPIPDDAKGIRDGAMMELLYATGIRASELLNLKVKDVNIKIGYINCRGGKKERVVPIYQEAQKKLAEYIKYARKEILKSTPETTDVLFINCNGTPMTRQGFWKIIKTYAVKAEIRKDITPNTFRHSFAIHMLENGADLKSIKEMLGHTYLSSTQVYAEIMNKKISEVYTKAHPKAKTKTDKK